MNPPLRCVSAILTMVAMRMVVPAAGGDFDGEPLPAAVESFQTALSTWDFAAMDAARARLASFRDTHPDSTDAAYWLAVADLHPVLAQFHRFTSTPDSDEAKMNRLRSALESTTALLRVDPSNAEGHAMHAILLGIRIDQSRFGALRYGRAFQEHLRQALAIGSDNPRVHFLIGSIRFHGPASLGGPDAALASFQTAAEEFPREEDRPRMPLQPRWGHSTCWAYIGHIHRRKNQPDTARDAFRRALQLNPRERLALEE